MALEIKTWSNLNFGQSVIKKQAKKINKGTPTANFQLGLLLIEISILLILIKKLIFLVIY